MEIWNFYAFPIVLVCYYFSIHGYASVYNNIDA